VYGSQDFRCCSTVTEVTNRLFRSLLRLTVRNVDAMPQTPSIPRIKPPALQPGDTIGIIAPASNIKRELLEAGCDTLRRIGYKPFYFDSILEKDLYFAGSADRRARELNEMFTRDDVRAIICARGGYGANYLLETLNLENIKTHPKIFVGYSDITSLLTYISDSVGLVTFHGPMVTKDFAHEDGVDSGFVATCRERCLRLDLQSGTRVGREAPGRRCRPRFSLRGMSFDAGRLVRHAL
jgi:muramoyltetrapeptide carboxypeptidase LdcA involved in peptidoglycan recycling